MPVLRQEMVPPHAGDSENLTLNEVADLIDSRNAELLRWGNYLNRRGIRGYYMQVKCGDHWCKISVSHADRHADRITVNELD